MHEAIAHQSSFLYRQNCCRSCGLCLVQTGVECYLRWMSVQLEFSVKQEGLGSGWRYQHNVGRGQIVVDVPILRQPAALSMSGFISERTHRSCESCGRCLLDGTERKTWHSSAEHGGVGGSCGAC